MEALAGRRLPPRVGPVAGVLIAALVVHALVLFLVLPQLSGTLLPHYGVGFADDYDKLANSLATGHGYRFDADLAPTLMREPGYPLVLAGVFKVFGYQLEAARLLNLLLALATALLVARLARRILPDPAVAAIAALLFLFHPGVFITEARGGFENLFMALLMGFMLVLHRATETYERKHFLAAGVFLGLVTLVRGTLIFFPFALLIYLLVVAVDAKQRIGAAKNVAVMLAAMVLVMSPWMARNIVVANDFVPTGSIVGVAMQTGQYICENLTPGNGFFELDVAASQERRQLAEQLGYRFQGDYYQYFYRTADELSFNRLLLANAANRYMEDPALFVKCASMNLFNFWFAGKSWKVTAVNMLIQLPLLIAAIAGAYLLWRSGRGRAIAVLGLCVFYLIGIHLPIIAHTRHSVPLVPLLAILASVAIVVLWRRIRHGSNTPSQ